MSNIQYFEDLIAWQKARVLTKEIYDVTRSDELAKDYGLVNQIRHTSVSIIAEGFERGGRNEFHQFLVIAKTSCAEVRSQLYIAYDIGYLSEALFNRLMNLAREVSRIIGSLRASVDRQRKNQK